MFILFALLLMIAASTATNPQDLSAVTYIKTCGGRDVVVRAACRTESAEEKVCNLERGGNLDLEVDFTTPSEDSTFTGHNLKADVKARLFGLDLPWPGFRTNACKADCGALPCPLKVDQKATYRYTADVKSSYPAVKTSFKWTLKDTDTGAVLFCFQMPVKLI